MNPLTPTNSGVSNYTLAGPSGIDMPSPSPPPVATADLVWHYTTAAGLLGVLNGHQFWASSATMLNDEEELKHGMSVVRSRFDALKRINTFNSHQLTAISKILDAADNRLLSEGVYILCASKQKDLLSQWRSYGESGVSGYALGLRAEYLTVVYDFFGQPTPEPLKMAGFF